jgi:hypothetical protein
LSNNTVDLLIKEEALPPLLWFIMQVPGYCPGHIKKIITAMSLMVFLSFLACPRKNQRRAPRNQSALRVPDPVCPKQVATLSLFPVLDICLGRLLTGIKRLFVFSEKPGIDPKSCTHRMADPLGLVLGG